MKGQALVVCCAALALGGCRLLSGSSGQKQVTLGYDLSGLASNPEGFTVRDGSVYFSANNSTLNMSGSILQITPEGKLRRVVNMPYHKDGTRVAPLGIAWNPDGKSLYVCDKQFNGKPEGRSCLWRVDFENGRPTQAVLLVRGFNHCNGIIVRDGYAYVTETFLRQAGDITWGAVFKFSLEELSGMKPVREFEASEKDPHFLVGIPTHSKGGYAFGANGLDFDKAGNLFVASFGDAVVWKVTFKPNGSVGSVKPFSDARKQIGLMTIDGLHYEGETDSLDVADLLGNTVARISAVTGKARVLARNMIPHDAPDGNLDNPADIIRCGNKLYIANYNMDFAPHVASAFQSIGVIQLDE